MNNVTYIFKIITDVNTPSKLSISKTNMIVWHVFLQVMFLIFHKQFVIESI